MGMYTGFRVKVKVKEEYREMVKSITEEGNSWDHFAPFVPFLGIYANFGRAEFIPRGAIAYMDPDWEEGFERSMNQKTGEWTFACSLKNYEGEIDTFLQDVLPNLISKSYHVERRYEEWEENKFYKLKNGIMIETDNPEERRE